MRSCGRTRRPSTSSRRGPGRSCGTRTGGGSCSTRGRRLNVVRRQRAVHRVCRVVRPLHVGQGARAGARGGPAVVREVRTAARGQLARRGVPRPVGVRRPRRGRVAHADHGAVCAGPAADPSIGWTAGSWGTRGRPTWRAGSCGSRCRRRGRASGSSRSSRRTSSTVARCCSSTARSGTCPRRRGRPGSQGGVWIASAESVLGPYDLAGAQRDRRPDPLRRQVHRRPRDGRDEVPRLPQRDRRPVHRRDHRPVCRVLGRRPPRLHARSRRSCRNRLIGRRRAPPLGS